MKENFKQVENIFYRNQLYVDLQFGFHIEEPGE